MNGGLSQMVLSLLSVLALIFVVAYFYRKKQSRSGYMNIVEYLSLGPKRGVAALKVGEEVLIVGITPNDFRLLKTFDEETFISGMAPDTLKKKNILTTILGGSNE